MRAAVATPAAVGLPAASSRTRSAPVAAATADVHISRADFVGIPTQDVERAVAFYVGTLGLRQDEHREAEFWIGEQCYGFWKPEWAGQEFSPSQTVLALHVDDVAAARAELEAKGIAFGRETIDTSVCHMALFTDPDGNALMLHKRYKPYE
jgi:predicted enzyme related to lactoylglutathione lyase